MKNLNVSRRHLLTLAGGAAAAAKWPLPAFAQEFPSRPMKLVVPLGPGGPTDVAARLVAQVVPSALGQPLVIENRPGAGGAIGSRAVATADPDGYTLMLANNATLCVVPALMKDPGYDPVKSFVPVSQVTESTLILALANNVPADNMKDFVAYAKANAGKLSFASAGIGNLTQLLVEVFKVRTGTDLIHVPYRSGGDMVRALLSEQVAMAFPDVSIMLPLLREKKLKALAVTAAKRHSELPDVPTMAEAGVPDFVMTFWSGVVAPAGTPDAIIRKLNAAIDIGLRSPEIQAVVAKIGAQTKPGSPEDFRKFIESESVKWRDIVRLAKIEPQ